MHPSLDSVCPGVGPFSADFLSSIPCFCHRSLLCWPELSLGVEPPTGASRTEPTLQLNGCGCMKTLGPPLYLLGVAPIRGQGQNPLLVPDWVVSSQDSCYRAVTTIGNKRHYHSCPEDGENSFSLELASGCVFRVFSIRECQLCRGRT